MNTVGRSTRQRTAVMELLEEIDEFRSAQEIHEQLRRRNTQIGLTTVYRTLQALADASEIDVMRPTGGDHLYRRCSESHHHHLVCRRCGSTVEVAGPTIERWTSKVADEHGFTDVSHTIEIFGTCASCQTVAQRTTPATDRKARSSY